MRLTPFAEALDKAINDHAPSAEHRSPGSAANSRMTASEVESLILSRTNGGGNGANKVYGSVAEMKRSKVGKAREVKRPQILFLCLSLNSLEGQFSV